MSLTPAQDVLEARLKKEAIELCGKNRGSHDYIPIEWTKTENVNRVTRLLCRVCFNNVETHVLLASYREIKL